MWGNRNHRAPTRLVVSRLSDSIFHFRSSETVSDSGELPIGTLPTHPQRLEFAVQVVTEIPGLVAGVDFASEVLLSGHEAQKVIVSTGCGVAPSSCRAT